MSSDQPSAVKQIVLGVVVAFGLIAGGRLIWSFYDSFPRGEPQTPEQFRDAMKDAMARDRANFERDWIASGKPLPPGGFDALFLPATPKAAAHEDQLLPPGDADSAGEGATR